MENWLFLTKCLLLSSSFLPDAHYCHVHISLNTLLSATSWIIFTYNFLCSLKLKLRWAESSNAIADPMEKGIFPYLLCEMFLSYQFQSWVCPKWGYLALNFLFTVSMLLTWMMDLWDPHLGHDSKNLLSENVILSLGIWKSVLGRELFLIFQSFAKFTMKSRKEV